MRAIKPERLDFLNWEFGVFFHFGIRTFYEGHRDWDMKEMSPEAFDPKELDCRQWLKTAKDAGAAYGILVCKHHDGFANWPSAYTEYSVKNTPWRGGKGDVVKEFTDACRELQMKVGLYYSPAQFGSVSRKAEEYDLYFLNQISELLTHYGKIDYLWFDSCGSEGHTYDQKRIVSEIRQMQPGILLFNMWDPDTRWIGNEAGVAPDCNRNVGRFFEGVVMEKQEEDIFLPAECDFRMRRDNWFYSDSDEDTVKSVEELMGLYQLSVGRGANFLVNIGPDRRGLLPEKDAGRLLEFGERLREAYGSPLPFGEPERNGNTVSLKAGDGILANCLILEEDLSEGGVIEEFSVYAYPFRHGERICVCSGKTVGHKRICSFSAIRTNRLDVEIKAPGNRFRLLKAQAFLVK